MRYTWSSVWLLLVHRCGSTGEIVIHLAPDMYHFLIMCWILFDAETDNAIERRVNEDERAILIQAL